MTTTAMTTRDMTTEWESRMRSRSLPLVWMSAFLFLCGCLSMGPDLVRSGDVRVRGSKDSPWRVLYAHARATEGELRVAGRVQQRRTMTLRPRGHLDLHVTSSDGVVLARATAKLRPNRGFRRRYRTASFAATLSVSPLEANQAIIQVTYCVAKH